MNDRLVEFSEALRAAGIPVSMTEVIDAAAALCFIGSNTREEFKLVLIATLVKSSDHLKVFEVLFDLFFTGAELKLGDLTIADECVVDQDFESKLTQAPGTANSLFELRELLLDAMTINDTAKLRHLARLVVQNYSNDNPNRSFSGSFALYRLLTDLDLEKLRTQLLLRLTPFYGDDSIGSLIAAELTDSLIETVRESIEMEIRRRSVFERGPSALAKTLRVKLIDDVDFMRASGEEISQMRNEIAPLARKFAAKLSQRRKVGASGTLDFRRTFRKSLEFGGAPILLRFHRRTLTKPEIFVLADISGSVASFSGFALQLLHAFSQQFSKVRSFVFIDAIDEVTTVIEESGFTGPDGAEVRVVDVDGHTNYGTAFERFVERYAVAVTNRSTILILGDARNNYHQSNSHLVELLSAKAKAIYWLNPEPRAYWNSGDSIMREYERFCTSVVECRNLRQLKVFVNKIMP